jgi:PII-like signaling protein
MSSVRAEGLSVRIFIGESDRLRGKPLHEVLVMTAREMGLPGATVVRGIEGFGARSVVHTSRLLRLSEDLPIVVEVVDLRQRIEPFVDTVEALLDEADCGGLITLEDVKIIRYKPGQ